MLFRFYMQYILIESFFVFWGGGVHVFKWSVNLQIVCYIGLQYVFKVIPYPVIFLMNNKFTIHQNLLHFTTVF